ncbi:Protein ANTAGONIST OF LIKE HETEROCHROMATIN PROTEIN 1 [Frankliniella fusca]|uniref:Protein ANTAGONIST OF LIKE HETEROCHROMATIN PROTEIN 1 n=1 Tax=Frankliniella fusca TaxID=407009 RepID=A0AAE1H352_9NEOP|nr:Protein ANTAGONIST OF LIKE HETEROCHROMATIN PROTEIN 1 [Frankliniella fusca]
MSSNSNIQTVSDLLIDGLYYRNLEDPYFKAHFRMDKPTFEILLNTVKHHRIATGRVVRGERTSVAETILIGSWMLFNKDTFRSAGENFGKAASNDHYHYKNLITIICEIGSRYIKWPSARERRRTARYYKDRFGLPRVAGSIDRTLIPITAPKEQKQRYVDKNLNYSINVMFVSDHRRFIGDAFIGQPGSVNDARVFRRSPLAQCLFSREDMLAPNEHLLGDCGYVCTDKILTQYRDNGHLNASRRFLNNVLSQCRSTIERCNGLLILRMQRLGRLFCKSIDTTILLIGASAVMHNLIILRGEEIDGMVLEAVPPINV